MLHQEKAGPLHIKNERWESILKGILAAPPKATPPNK